MNCLSFRTEAPRPHFLSFSATTAAVLAALLLSVSFAGADDTVQRGHQICAAQDLKLENVLSDSILSQELPAERYVAAAEFRLSARRACAAGRFDEGLMLYEEAAHAAGLHLGG